MYDDAHMQRLKDEAERLEVPFACVDDRPNPPTRALEVQACFFADVLSANKVKVTGVSRIGVVSIATPGGKRRDYTVEQLRSLLREKGSAKEMALHVLLGIAPAQ